MEEGGRVVKEYLGIWCELYEMERYLLDSSAHSALTATPALEEV